ncbi:ABC transporter ATP-binding protein [Streptomyces calidiresistens]|uniref:ABC-type quaternary amine transporter n=1 Tax=Streptomyces calidiresistens TaxID=1485586 RepID=A0A7W3XWJ6_9ACTN|nr:ABC transporter ATP-binding protein [Streptomyces calidiresistens]MBB0229792.1 ATP-binding cassette domain-containing protein [Streptomyces calidiresistens]
MGTTGTTDGPLLRLEGITVRFAGAQGPPAVDGVDLEVPAGRTVCVLGPSGSGKSTLLRVVAGLRRPDGGRVLLEGRDQARVPAHRRGVGLMFQDHQLFPQRDVLGNVLFGLRMRGTDRATARARAEELLRLVGLPEAGGRAPASLSGGEQQRVALARALAPEPRVLMLDEPLGQLDRDLRERLAVELRALFRTLGTTVLAVTHDQGEAFAMADRLVVMERGRVAQVGTPVEVWQRPASAFVARFLGFRNLVPVEAVGERRVRSPWGEIPFDPVPGTGSSGLPETWRGRAQLLVRPGGVRIIGGATDPVDDAGAGDAGAGAGTATPRCVVTGRTFRGDHVVLVLRPERGPTVEAACPLRGAPEEGEVVRIRFDPAETVALPPGEAGDRWEAPAPEG